MKKGFTFTLICIVLFLSFSSQAQRYVKIPETTDYENPTDLYLEIMGDTLPSGERVNENTIYQLVNGGYYVTSYELVNKSNWPLQIEAVDLNNTDNKPFLATIPNSSATYSPMFNTEGNVMLRNLWLIGGEKGPLEDYTAGFFFKGDNSRVVLEDCIFEKDRYGLRFEAKSMKAYVNNCVIRNIGPRRGTNGNGRAFDPRTYSLDSLVVTNTIIHNISDRIFRSMGAETPHNYIEFDHNTIFNQYGRTGCFQFGAVKEVVVTNNLFCNPIMVGTPTDDEKVWEQTQVDADEKKLFTIDGENLTTQFTFANNNIFYTQDVLDFYATIPAKGKIPNVYSKEIVRLLGGETASAATYFTEILEFNSSPMSILQWVKDTYEDRTSTDMFDHIVEDISRQGTAYDSGNLFNFSTFDIGYDVASQSARGDTDGGSVGAVQLVAASISSIGVDLNEFKAYPNPASKNITFEYEVKKSGHVKISIFDMSGKECQTLVNQNQPTGKMLVNFNTRQQLAPGIYQVSLQTEIGKTTKRLIIN